MTWFWIVTLTWSDPQGSATNTASGRLTLDQAAALGTRAAAYDALVDAGRRGMGIPDGVAAPVLFFSHEPDTLTATVPEPAHAVGGAR